MHGFGSIAKIVLALMLLLLLIRMGLAQERVIQDLHASGYAGMSFDRDTSSFTTSQGLSEEVSTNLNGAVFNPDFVSFGTSLTAARNSNSLNQVPIGASTILAGSANFMLLPGSFYPLVISYQRTRVGIGEQGLSTYNDTDYLGFDWRLKFSKLPKLQVRYEKDSNSSEVPVATLVPSQSNGSGFSIAANDTYAGWQWNAAWMRSDSQTSEQLINVPLTLTQNYSILAAGVLKRYWDNKGQFSYSLSRNTTDTTSGTLSAQNGTQTAQSAATSVRFSPKLTAVGAFQYYTFQNDARVPDPTDPTHVSFLLEYPASGYIGSASVSYQLHPRISVSDSTSISVANVPPSEQETGDRFLGNTPTVAANYTWHRIRLSGSYGLGLYQTSTTIGRTIDDLANVGSGSAGWGNGWVSLNGSFGIGHSTYGSLPGSYSDFTNYLFTADSDKFPRIGKLRFRWQKMDQSILAAMGHAQTATTSWAVTVIRRKWQVEGGEQSGSGAQRAFGVPIFVYEPLPPLLGGPLISTTVHDWFIVGSGNLRPNLQIRGSYRKNLTALPFSSGSSDYSMVEFYLDYRIGKITINASYGRYVNSSNTPTSAWGATGDRLRFRIVRSFNWF